MSLTVYRGFSIDLFQYLSDQFFLSTDYTDLTRIHFEGVDVFPKIRENLRNLWTIRKFSRISTWGMKQV